MKSYIKHKNKKSKIWKIKTSRLLLLFLVAHGFWNTQLKHKPFNWHHPVQCCKMKISKISDIYHKYRKYPIFSKISQYFPSLTVAYRHSISPKTIPGFFVFPHMSVVVVFRKLMSLLRTSSLMFRWRWTERMSAEYVTAAPHKRSCWASLMTGSWRCPSAGMKQTTNITWRMLRCRTALSRVIYRSLMLRHTQINPVRFMNTIQWIMR